MKKELVWKVARVSYMAVDKGYGFIDGQDDRVFFHKAGFCRPFVETQPVPHVAVKATDVRDKSPCPKIGDWLVYTEEENDKGIIAPMWCFREDWDKAETDVKSQAQYRLVYRQMAQSAPKGNAKKKCWEQTSEVQQQIYDPTYDPHTIMMLLEYRGAEMIRVGQCQLQKCEAGTDNWVALSADEVAKISREHACFFLDNSLWQYEVGQQQTKKVA